MKLTRRRSRRPATRTDPVNTGMRQPLTGRSMSLPRSSPPRSSSWKENRTGLGDVDGGQKVGGVQVEGRAGVRHNGRGLDRGVG
jgi:hypothetical protein